MLVGAAMSLGALVGCSAEPAKDASGSSTPSATSGASEQQSSSASTSVAPTAPVYPDAATKNDLAGQEAFVRHWFDAYNYAWQTGDLGPVRALSEAEQSNDALWRPVEELYGSGGRQVGGGYEVIDVVQFPASPEGISSPTVTTVWHEGIEYDADGRTSTVAAVPAETLGMTLVYRSDRWHFFGFGTL